MRQWRMQDQDEGKKRDETRRERLRERCGSGAEASVNARTRLATEGEGGPTRVELGVCGCTLPSGPDRMVVRSRLAAKEPLPGLGAGDTATGRRQGGWRAGRLEAGSWRAMAARHPLTRLRLLVPSRPATHDLAGT